MTGLDTNILVRFLTHDDPAQTAVAIRVMSELTEEEPGFVSAVVLAETSWVLSRSFGHSTTEVGEVLLRLAEAVELQIESEPEALLAIEGAKNGNGDFADILIAGLAKRAGCGMTLTFDERAARLPGFQLAI